jgi:hypothetical protein
MIGDRRDQMSLSELVEELHLAHPEEVAYFEREYRDAMEAIENDDLDSCDEDELDELHADLSQRLRI